MIDIRTTIAPKSDQMNADDLIGGPRTIKVTKVSLLAAADQPIAINFEGDNGKPYKPCKSMRRVMVTVWGADGAAYAGRSMTLYRDDTVAFGGQQVGGIRISHMTNIARPVTMALTATRGSRKGFTVHPLADPMADLEAQANSAAAKGSASYVAFWGQMNKDQRKALLAGHENRKSIAAAADAERLRQESEGADDRAETGEVTDDAPQADDATDWPQVLSDLKAKADACANTADLVKLKAENAAIIKDLPDDLFADWTDYADNRAAILKGDA